MQFEPEPEAEAEAWQPAEPVMMEEEVVPVEAEAESEPIGASEVVPEVVEGAEDVTEPVVASETMEREAPAEGAAEEPRGWLSSLFGPRRKTLPGGFLPGGPWAESAVDPRVTEEGGVMRLEAKLRARDGSLKDASVTFKPGDRFYNWDGRFKKRKQSPPPEELYTGPRSDGLLSTDDISGDYRSCCFPSVCTSMTVVPLGADMIEARKSYWFFLPPLCVGPCGDGDVWIRDPDTNAFHRWKDKSDVVTFSADGTAGWNAKPFWECLDDACDPCYGTAMAKWGFRNLSYQKKTASQKRTFQQVDTRDLAGCWCSCICIPCVPCWVCSICTSGCFSGCLCTTKKALNQDQYEESGCGCSLAPPFIVLPRRDDPGRAGPYTRTRFYANGHPTNGFYDGIYISSLQLNFTRWYSDASCGYSEEVVFSKKLC